MQREIDMIVRQLLLKSFLLKYISKLFHVTKDIRKSRFVAFFLPIFVSCLGTRNLETITFQLEASSKDDGFWHRPRRSVEIS